jgi:GTP-binding protein HflX
MRSTRITPSTAPLERAFLVGVTLPRRRREDEFQNLSELELLARSAGADVVGRTLQSRTRIDGTTFVGSGKIEELAREIHDRGANLVIFDDDLSPAQARNIEKILDVNVIDRTELILDIFARRARTRQARIQVEIAQLNYALPRLRRLWEHLSRQAGGIGTRGAGERRKRREGIFTVTIVGYTNAGKSTLLNRLAGSSVLESDRLFSTLDSTTRRVQSPEGEPFLLTDTVGFIRKLPHHLVESFKVTLLDVREADLLLHVADASIERCDDHVAVVNGVLDEVLARRGPEETGVPTLLVLNKIDLVEEAGRRNALAARYPEAVMTSAATGEGTEELLRIVGAHLGKDLLDAEIRVSSGDGRAIALIERSAKVLSRRLDGGRMVFRVKLRRRELGILEGEPAIRLRLAPSSS